MAGWSKDFLADKPYASLIMGEPLVLFRDSHARLHAMEDRCCHRLAPLSHGLIEGDSLRCMYHGLRFATDGRCVEIPGKESVPAALKVRTFPVVEKYSGVWVWMGDAAKADLAEIPNFVGVDDPAWSMLPGHMDYTAHHKLIEDNLLDLSHLPYVHRASFGQSDPERNAAWANAVVRYKELPRGIHVERWMPNSPAPRHLADKVDRVDTVTAYDYVVPGVFLLTTASYPVGAVERSDNGGSPGEPLFDSFSCQAVTPRSEKSTTYFFAYGPRAAFGHLKETFRDLALVAFAEDRTLIEAQQRVIDADPSRKMTLLDLDRGPAMYDRVVERLRREAAPIAQRA